jgi:hypothetical protein
LAQKISGGRNNGHDIDKEILPVHARGEAPVLEISEYAESDQGYEQGRMDDRKSL